MGGNDEFIANDLEFIRIPGNGFSQSSYIFDLQGLYTALQPATAEKFLHGFTDRIFTHDTKLVVVKLKV